MERKKITLFIILAVVLLGLVFLPGFSELNRRREENVQLKKRIRFLEEHNDQLKGELVQLKQDPTYVEQKAREKLGVVKKGEIIYGDSREN
ncbi:MAG: septum formation initiator family protein [Candidatus Tantalella remota]|nr:septum formation initiator family protein [Candidatus Tantalella remota]